MGDRNSVDDDMAMESKVDTDRDGTPSSLESTPEHDLGPEPAQEPSQPQKRKGGRKPIYATSEERKQRNRQAQAAFRERRTEYIKQLEATIKQNEESLASLQQNHRTAADECLMLRYKNSLLERILLEKGIDVQAELQMKTGSPVLGSGFMHPAGMTPFQQQPAQLQRAAMQRQQVRRSTGQNFLPKLAPGQPNADMNFPASSPHAHPTPSSHASSPSQMSTRSPMAMHQGGMTPPATAVQAQPQGQYFPRSSQQPANPAFYPGQPQPAAISRPPQRPAPSSNYQGSTSGMSSHSTSSHQSIAQPKASGPATTVPGVGTAASAFYPSPFQKHFDQLDQEYDTHQTRSMLDDPDPDDHTSNPMPTSLHGPYPPHFDPSHAQPHGEFYPDQSGMPPGQQQMTPQTHYEQLQLLPPTSHPGQSDEHYNVDPNDPILDADPFGLSASMHYPTNYSFEPNQGLR